MIKMIPETQNSFNWY